MSGLVHLTSEGTPSRAAESFAYSKALSLLRAGANFLCINLVHDGSNIAINIRGGTAYVRVSGKVIRWLATVNIGGELHVYGSNNITDGFSLYKKQFSSRTTLDQIGSYESPGNGIEVTLVDYLYPSFVEAYLGTVGAPKFVYGAPQSDGYTYAIATKNTVSGFKYSLNIIDTEFGNKPRISNTLNYSDPLFPTYEYLDTQKEFSPDSEYAGVGFRVIAGNVSSIRDSSRPLVYIVDASTSPAASRWAYWPYSRIYRDLRDPDHPLSQVGQEYPFVISPYIAVKNEYSTTAVPLDTVFSYEGASSKEFFGSFSYVGNGKYIIAVKIFYPDYVSIESATFDTNTLSLYNHTSLTTIPKVSTAYIRPNVSVDCYGLGTAFIELQEYTQGFKTFDFGASWTSLEFNGGGVVRDILYNPNTESPMCKVVAVGQTVVSEIDGSLYTLVLQSQDITPETSEIIWKIIGQIKTSNVRDLTKVGAPSDPEWSDQIDKWSV